MSKALDKARAREWVSSVDDERAYGDGYMVYLKEPWCFEDDPQCGVRGCDTATEAEIVSRKSNCYEEK